jgi:hypothetical protein
MTTETAHPFTSPRISLNTPRLRQAQFDDYPQIQTLEAASLPEALPSDDWRRQWLDNPLWPRLGTDWPIGWVLEDNAGQIVGSLSNVPSAYVYRSRELICANGRAWVTTPEYRGFALWLMDEYFNQSRADLFINTTVNAVAAQVFGTLAERIPLGDWQSSSFWVTGYVGFAREALAKVGVQLPGVLAYPAAAALWIRDAARLGGLPAADRAVDIAITDSFDSRFNDFWQELVRQNTDKLLGVRDSQTLAWHYAIPIRRRQIVVLTASRNGLLRGFCVVKRQDTKQGLRRLRLVDYQSLDTGNDLLPGLLRAALVYCRTQGCHVLEHLGCDVPKMRAFDEFAPYRRKLASWTFYCRASDAALNQELQLREVWDPSEFDGDASFS